MADPMVARRVEIRLPAAESTDELKDALSDFARTLSDLASPRVKLILRGQRDDVRRLDLELVGRAADVASVVEAVGRLGAQVMRDEVLPAPGAAKDEPYPDPESARRIAAPEAAGPSHSPTTTEPPIEPVIVAIIDSGIMAAHPNLLRNLWSDRKPPGAHGRNMIESEPTDNIDDEDGHGTMLAGTVLAGANRSPAVRLMAVKLFDGRTRPESDRAARAIDWAVDHGASILNLSWAVGVDKPALRDGKWKPAVQDAIARAGHDVLVVVAAGNSGADNDHYPTYPAVYGRTMENVITVMATDDLDDKPGFSNYGAESVHIAAPGMRVTSTHPYLAATLDPSDREKYQRYDGTSAAAAYVSGAAALLKSVCPGLRAKELKDYLITTADPSRDRRRGAKPRLNLGQALAAVRAGCRPADGTSDEVLAAARG